MLSSVLTCGYACGCANICLSGVVIAWYHTLTAGGGGLRVSGPGPSTPSTSPAPGSGPAPPRSEGPPLHRPRDDTRKSRRRRTTHLRHMHIAHSLETRESRPRPGSRLPRAARAIYGTIVHTHSYIQPEPLSIGIARRSRGTRRRGRSRSTRTPCTERRT